MSRDEHMAWAKRRALEYVDAGDLTSAVASMGSDLQKHPELLAEAGTQMAVLLGIFEIKNGSRAVRRWIEGFAPFGPPPPIESPDATPATAPEPQNVQDKKEGPQ